MTRFEKFKGNRYLTASIFLLLPVFLSGQFSSATAFSRLNVSFDTSYGALEASDTENKNSDNNSFTPDFIHAASNASQVDGVYQTEYNLEPVHIDKHFYAYSIRSPPIPFQLVS